MRRSEKLAKKLEVLQRKISREKSVSQIEDVLEALKAAEASYQIIYPDEPEHAELTGWLESHFPITMWGKIQWSEVPGSSSYEYADDDDLQAKLEMLVEQARIGNPKIFVTWSNGACAAIKIEMAVFIRHALTIFWADFDTWVLSMDECWCIEHYHEGELGFGRCLEQNGSAARGHEDEGTS